MTHPQDTTPANPAQGASEALALIAAARSLRDRDAWSGEAGEMEKKAGGIVKALLDAEADSKPIGPVSWPGKLREAIGRYAALNAAIGAGELRAEALADIREVIVAKEATIERLSAELARARADVIEECAKVADRRAAMANQVSHEASRALLQALPDAIRAIIEKEPQG